MCHKLQALSVHGCRKLLEDGMVAVSEHCDLLESLDVGHTLIRMDAVIQVIERNEGLVYLNIDHHILEYEELPALLQPYYEALTKRSRSRRIPRDNDTS